MTTPTATISAGATTDPSARRLRQILMFAAATTMVAVVAGVVLLLAAPEQGGRTDAILAVTAASSGIATGVLAIAASIYAALAGLWQRVPIRLRYVSWAVLGALIVRNIWIQIQAI